MRIDKPYYPLLLSYILTAYLLVTLSGCSFSVGVDWNGRTDKDFRTVSPEKRVTNER